MQRRAAATGRPSRPRNEALILMGAVHATAPIKLWVGFRRMASAARRRRPARRWPGGYGMQLPRFMWEQYAKGFPPTDIYVC